MKKSNCTAFDREIEGAMTTVVVEGDSEERVTIAVTAMVTISSLSPSTQEQIVHALTDTCLRSFRAFISFLTHVAQLLSAN